MWIEGEVFEVFGSFWVCVFIEFYYNLVCGCVFNDNIKEYFRICWCYYFVCDLKKLDSWFELMINSLKFYFERWKVSLILKNYEFIRWFLICD